MATANVRKQAAYKYVIANRNYRRARERALTRLSQLHKEQYLELLAQEKDRDITEGKAWRITDPAFSDNSGDDTLATDRGDTYHQAHHQGAKSNIGGKA